MRSAGRKTNKRSRIFTAKSIAYLSLEDLRK
jgi:hypothetical protein